MEIEHRENYFNIFSNLVCLLPTALFLSDKNYYDALIVLGTGITSFIYHLNNNNPRVFSDHFVEPDAIRVDDVMMSSILIFQIGSYLAFYKSYHLRSALLFIFLPFEIYLSASTINGTTHLYIIFTLLGGFIALILYRMYRRNHLLSKYMVCLLCGMALNAVGIVMYADLQEKHDEKYNLFHGFHHTTAFLSILFYYSVPRDSIASNNPSRTLSDVYQSTPYRINIQTPSSSNNHRSPTPTSSPIHSPTNRRRQFLTTMTDHSTIGYSPISGSPDLRDYSEYKNNLHRPEDIHCYNRNSPNGQNGHATYFYISSNSAKDKPTEPEST